MKKTIVLLLTLLLCLFFAACGQAETVTSPAESTVPESAAPDAQEGGSPEAGVIVEADPAGAEEAEKLAAILESIDQNAAPGTAGSSLRAAGEAAKLLDWAAQTGMSAEDARSATVGWMSPKGNDAQTVFAEKLASVDEACAQLKGENAQGLLEDAGCTGSAYPWNEQAYVIAEAIMAAAGLR